MSHELTYKYLRYLIKKHQGYLYTTLHALADKVLQLQRENRQLRKELYKLRKKG